MFTITLCYPSGHPGNGANETVRSGFIPQIGMEISGSTMRYGTYRVARVSGSTASSRRKKDCALATAGNAVAARRAATGASFIAAP